MAMSHPGSAASGYSVEAYFGLVHDGILDEDDRVELLDGVIVAEPPMDPPHASGISYATEAIQRAVGARALVRIQAPFIADPFSVPEPDLAVIRGTKADYLDCHPTSALLVVEVSDSSLQQDRLSKSRIYAGAAVPEYWIVNLRDDRVEVFRQPDADQRVYGERVIANRGERLELVALPGAVVAVDDLLPPPRGRAAGFSSRAKVPRSPSSRTALAFLVPWRGKIAKRVNPREGRSRLG
jgi:Uma2 family endonuclease